MRPTGRSIASALLFAAIVAAGACRREAPGPIAWEPERRSAAVIAPGASLVITERGVPAALAAFAPPRWPADSAACAATTVVRYAGGDTVFAAWWSLAPRGLLLRAAVSADAGVTWEPAHLVARAPRTRCGPPAPSLAFEGTTGQLALAFHGVATDTAGIVVAVMNRSLQATGPVTLVAAGLTPRAASVALAGDTVAVAFESPTADGAVRLAIWHRSGQIVGEGQVVTGAGARAYAPIVALRAGQVAVAWNEAPGGGNGPAAVVRVGHLVP